MSETAQLAPLAAPRYSARRLVGVIGLALALGYLVFLAGAFFQGQFLTDVQGRIIANDFVDVFAAGRLTLSGYPASAYDWTIHKAAEAQALGHDFPDYYGWHYPPPFLVVAAGLATLPYLAAMLIWLVATLAAYAMVLRAILHDRAGVLLGLGFPAAIWNVTAGQNGFLTATLIGGSLSLMETRPQLAGILLGLLTYKPQFGLLFPLVLIADRRWQMTLTAALTTIAMGAASWFAFGGGTWEAFVHWMPVTSRIVLGEGAADWNRLQSFFGLVRAHGGSETLAWTVQGLATLTIAAWLVLLWRSRASFDLKAAAVSTGTLLATPYVYTYDLAVLGVPVAFLLRFMLHRGWSSGDIAGLFCAGGLLLSFPFVNTHVGLAAVLLVLALVAKRVDVRSSSLKAQRLPAC